MTFEEYLKNQQPIVYHTFFNALKNNRLSHAYLIKGNDGAPLLECAKFLAKSLICYEPTPFACENCLACNRFDDGNFADFKLLDGANNNIKVSDIEALQAFFQSTPSEKNGKMIYIINLLENSNKESLNALLKFLEEPQDNVYAFITTANEDRLLPTILSRMQHLKLLPLDHQNIVSLAIEHGISKDDSELLSHLYGNIDTLIKTATDKNYIKIKDLVFDVLECLNKSNKEMLYYIETAVIPVVKDKASARLFLDILSIAFKDILNSSMNASLVLASHARLIQSLSKQIKNIENCYLEIMFARGQIDLNVNLGLLIEHVANTIYQGVN